MKYVVSNMNNHKALKFIIVFSISTVLAACVNQTRKSSSPDFNSAYTQYPYYRVTSDRYSAFYERLSTLSQPQFEQQVTLVKDQSISTSQQIELALLYAHRNSPVRNVHRSQKILAAQLEVLSDHPQTGWLEALHDQMLDSIRWQNRFEKLETDLIVAKQSREQLESEVDKLNGQLKQLTQLEQQLHDNK